MNKEWSRYLELLKERPEEFSGTGFPVVTDEPTVHQFEQEHGVTIGVIYESKWHLWVVDLVRNPETDTMFTYERMMYVQPKGSVGILPFYRGKIVLVREYRHALQDYQWGIPRGFGEQGISPAQNAVKELTEETGAKSVANLRHLGQIVTDAGASGAKVDIFAAEVDGLFSLDKGEITEKIDQIATFSEADIYQMLARGEFTDGFTLTALALWHAQGGSPLEDKLKV